MDDEQWARIEAKRARNAYFNRLNYEAKHPKPVRTARPEQNGHAEPRKRKPRVWTPTGRPKGRPRTAPEKCVGCGIKLRIAPAKAGDFPGEITRRYDGHGMCVTCNRHSKGYSKPAHRVALAPNCPGCGRPMRLRTERAGDKPGTVRHEAGGLCTTCWRSKEK